MTVRPIIFSAPMVLALLAGRKTQTRRLLWSQPRPSSIVRSVASAPKRIPLAACEPGDILYVRESMGWDKGDTNRLFYRADGATIEAEPPRGYAIFNTHAPSIHMPRWASRLTLAVEDVRVERLQDITKADAVAEGVELSHAASCPVIAYSTLWNLLHGDGQWEANPEVLALTFRVIHGNVDQVPL